MEICSRSSLSKSAYLRRCLCYHQRIMAPEESAKSDTANAAAVVPQGGTTASQREPSPKGEFVFYDGPPFATGLPHYGHILASTIKDVIPRYKTMRGYHVRRR